MFIKQLFFTFIIITSIHAENINIATGSKGGVYYPTGKNICSIINKNVKSIKCKAIPSKGSIYNIKNLKANKFKLAIAQSDTIFLAYNSLNTFKNSNFKNIRTIITIYPELFTFIVNKSSKIKKIHDIKGKIINIGPKGSGERATAQMLFNKARPLNEMMMKKTEEFALEKTQDLLIKNKIDGYFMMIGHPYYKIQELAKIHDIDIVEVSPDTCLAVKNILVKNPFYTLEEIPKNTYHGIDHAIKSFGVKATLITTKEADYDLIYQIISTIMEHFDEFKKLHPAYKNITKTSVIKGLGAPLHPAARDYLKRHNIL